MRITYVTHTRFPTEKAHGYQIAQVCHALTELGNTVTVLHPTVKNAITKSAAEYYGMKPTFKTAQIRHFDALNAKFLPGFLGFAIGIRFSFNRALRKFLKTHRTDLFYIRSHVLLASLLKTNVPVLLELHTLPRRGKRRFVRLANRTQKIVCLTSPMRTALIAMGVTASRITVEPDGVDLARFQTLPNLKEARAHQIDLPRDAEVIGYAGGLTALNTLDKGVSVLLGALKRMKAHPRAILLLAGGSKQEVERMRGRARDLQIEDRVIFRGHMRSKEIPALLAACDVLVYPAPASDHPYFRRDTSPLKILEYLAAERPVVCADLPPLRDIVDDTVVTFATAGEEVSFAHWVTWVLDHPKEAVTKALAGKKRVERFSWEKRMKRILKAAK